MKARFMSWKTAAVILAISVPVWSQTPVFDSGSDGSDGAFNPTENMVFAIDQQEYNFTSINIPAGVTVTFTPDMGSNWPVTWLSQGDVTIDGVIDLSGATGHSNLASFKGPAQGGPGGWQGGTGATAVSVDPDLTTAATGGWGPGGALGSSGSAAGSGAGYLTMGALGPGGTANSAGRAYGNAFGIPAIGGSGGGGAAFVSGRPGSGGGGGGGALLLASSTTIDVSGTIRSNGGNGGSPDEDNARLGGGGSGGLVRLVANHISVSGALEANGGTGGDELEFSATPGGVGSDGRIRLDAFTYDLTGTSSPSASTGVPILVDVPESTPRMRIVRIDGQDITNPTGAAGVPDIVLSTGEEVLVEIEANNIPAGATAPSVRVMAANGPSQVLSSSVLAGTLEMSTSTAMIAFQAGVSQITATITFSPVQRLRAANGEEVASVTIETDLTGESRTLYITASGKEFTQAFPIQ